MELYVSISCRPAVPPLDWQNDSHGLHARSRLVQPMFWSHAKLELQATSIHPYVCLSQFEFLRIESLSQRHHRLPSIHLTILSFPQVLAVQWTLFTRWPLSPSVMTMDTRELPSLFLTVWQNSEMRSPARIGIPWIVQNLSLLQLCLLLQQSEKLLRIGPSHPRSTIEWSPTASLNYQGSLPRCSRPGKLRSTASRCFVHTPSSVLG